MANKTIRFLDNTTYKLKNKISEDNESYVKEMPSFHGATKECENILTELSDCTIEQLSTNQDDNVLVWPYSFSKECRCDISKMTILNYVKDHSLVTNNLVGFIGKGDVEIEIKSRFTPDGGGQDFFLYYMLSKVFAFNLVNLDVGSGNLKELDLLTFVFPRILKNALRQGVYKRYVKREYNDSNLRGVIDINRHIRQNYPPNGRIAYNTREFSYDNDVTQLVRHTIEYLYSKPLGRSLLNNDKETEWCVRNIIQSTPTYNKNEKRKVISANRTPLSHPYYSGYKALQQICLAILRNEKISYGSMDNKLHGLLIDVAWVWEEYIGTLMRTVGFNHYTSQNTFKLLRDDDKKPFQPIIPDYLWQCEKGYLVADAKYIPLHRLRKIDAERASAIYYKTIMYMYRFATHTGILFHPCSHGDAQKLQQSDERITFFDYEIDNGRDCHLYELGLVIPSEQSDYAKFRDLIADREKRFREETEKCCSRLLI